MLLPSQDNLSNGLLKALLPEDFELIRASLERVELEKGAVLSDPDQLISHAYFLECGLGSVVAASPEGRQTEVHLFGRDGMAGSALVLGVDLVPCRTFIQVAGFGYRVRAADLQRQCAKSASLRRLLLHFVHTAWVQTSYTALSNASHKMEERLARWLLMSHDRSDGDDIPLTHEFLALMLSVRRAGVTVTLSALERMELIRVTRGLVSITNRVGLERLAGDAYGVPEAEYERLIGPLRRSPTAALRATSSRAPSLASDPSDAETV